MRKVLFYIFTIIFSSDSYEISFGNQMKNSVIRENCVTTRGLGWHPGKLKSFEIKSIIPIVFSSK